MSSIDPVIGAFQIARAYQAASSPRVAKPLAPAGAVPAQPMASAAARKLVAGSVAGRVNFVVGDETGHGAALAMYRHPAEKNAAATAVTAGRVIDVTG